MHPQLQLLVALQDLDEMIHETEEKGSELEGLGFKHGGLEDLKKSREDLRKQIEPGHLKIGRASCRERV